MLEESLNCILCKAANIIGNDLGTLVFENGDVTSAAFVLPDKEHGNNFPPKGTKVNGILLSVCQIDSKPSGWMGVKDQLIHTIGLCVATYDQSDKLATVANLLKQKMGELYDVKYYKSNELENPEKFILLGRYLE
jgi:hypothetical protein